jgi:type I restriction enzyme S subunit
VGVRDATGNHGREIFETREQVTQAGIDNSSARVLPAGTVCLSRTASVGYVVMMGRPMATSQDFVNWVCGPELNPRYLKYILELEQESIRRFAHGTTHQTMYYPEAKALHVCVPSRDLQDGIVEVVGALDSLVETDRRLIADLDVTVRLLGQRLLASRRFETVPMSDVAEIAKGYSYKSSELIDGGKRLVNLKNIGRRGEFQARGFKPLDATVKAHQVVDSGTVVVAQTDLTQDREVIARPVRVRRGGVTGELVASLDLVIVRPKLPHTEETVFAILDQSRFRTHALGYCNGTTVLHMGARAIPDFLAPALMPAEIESLTCQVRPLHQAADDLTLEVAELEAVRNELLPLLMAGRVRVRDAVA